MGTHKHYGQANPADVRGGLLAVKSYAPATETAIGTTSTTATPVDATNLAATITVPPSGKVVVRLYAAASHSNFSRQAHWYVLDGTNAVLARRFAYSFATGALDFSQSLALEVTGLTPGASTTLRWGFSTGVSDSTSYIYCGGTHGPAVMEVAAG